MRNDLLILIFALTIMALVYYKAERFTEDTDPKTGLPIITDEETGCQYLKNGYFYGRLPRLDDKGRQICVPVNLKP